MGVEKKKKTDDENKKYNTMENNCNTNRNWEFCSCSGGYIYIVRCRVYARSRIHRPNAHGIGDFLFIIRNTCTLW